MSSKLTLGQFLKLALLLDSGAEAKDAVTSGAVSVNDEVDTRRGRGLVDGDVVEIGGRAARVSRATDGERPDGGRDAADDPGSGRVAR
ncbi:RNA-binding S4 domain-containing protein [Dietzia maris]|uniref:RNA-binding S4 domain-containing protein n=1 Tax=Dietzia maris TaxID=37915 RepID=A0A365PA52_9ACTN|nr:RNA-binding S4 domain-containing protein [Dietzia maris]